jgi:hypothetical protein
MHPQQCSPSLHGHHKHSQANHHKSLHGIVYPSYSSVGTCMPARNRSPLDLASICKHAWYIKKIPYYVCILQRYTTAKGINRNKARGSARHRMHGKTANQAKQELKPELKPAHWWVQSSWYGMTAQPPVKRSNTIAIHEIISPDQANTQLTQSARNKRRPRHTTRPGRFVS